MTKPLSNSKHTSNRPAFQAVKAIILVLLAALFYALTSAMVKFCSSEVSTESIVFFRMIVSFLLFIPYFFTKKAHKKKKISLKTGRITLHIVRALAALFAIYSSYYAIRYIPIGNAILLTFSAPLFVPIIAWLWKGIPIIPKLWWGLVIAYIGIFFVLEPQRGAINPASLIALLGGVSVAVSMIATRLLHYTESTDKILFHYFWMGSLISFIIAIREIVNNTSSLSTSIWIGLILVGVFGTFYQFSMTGSLKFAPARYISTFMYISVAFANILDWVIWHQAPSVASILGLILVFAGAFLNAYIYPENDMPAS